METSTIEAKYKELLFLAPTEDPKLQFILLIHAINLAFDLKCTGLLEDDPEGEFVIPPNWTKDSDGVYSFRYYDAKAKDSVYFKFVTEDTMVDINAVCASKNDKINSIDFKLSNYSQFNTEAISEIYKRYRSEFMPKILPHLKPKEEEKKAVLLEDRRFPVNDDGRGLFWNIPRNDHRPENPFGDFGRSDLFPNIDPLRPGVDPNSQGNVLGPRNPIFTNGPNNIQPGINGPHIRWDPTGPIGIDPSNPDPDLFPPMQRGPNLRDPRNPFGGGGFPGGGFGGGGFGGGGFGGGGLI